MPHRRQSLFDPVKHKANGYQLFPNPHGLVAQGSENGVEKPDGLHFLYQVVEEHNELRVVNY